MPLSCCASVSYLFPWEGPSELSWGHPPIRRPQAAPYFDSKTDQPEEQDSIPSHIIQTVDSSIRDKEIPGRATNAQPERISLGPETAYPNKRQYPIQLEAKKGLKPLIDKFLKQGLLVPCSLCAIHLFC